MRISKRIVLGCAMVLAVTVAAVPPAIAAGTLTADEAFVTSAYTDFLGRPPTAGELSLATSVAMGAQFNRAALVSQLAKSPEWIQVTVDKLYTDTLGRPGDPSGTAYWVGQLSSGRKTVAQVAALFYSSSEYFAGYGQSDAHTWVIDLYTKILHRDGNADPSGVAYWVDQTERHGRAPVALSFYQSNESRHTRVASLYETLLGRAPEADGWNYWAAAIAKQGDLALAANLASSHEYYARAANTFGNGLPTIPTSLTFTQTWSTNLGTGHMVVNSSPTVASLDGGAPMVIVGDRGGYVNALRLTTGAKVWSASTAGVAVDATASVAGSGANARIYVGVGTSASPNNGGYLALNNTGGRLWYVHPKLTPNGGTIGVMSGMTVGNFQGTNDVVGGSMGQLTYGLNTNGGALSGFPWFAADSNFTTPGNADINHDGHPEIIMGGDSSAGTGYGHQYANGGHIRILSPRGGTASGAVPNGLRCEYDTNQVVQSSPAIGGFLSGGALGIVAGTGTYWSGASDTNKLIAVDQNCHLRWKVDLGGNTSASPALADIRGTGHLDVIAGTRASASSGTVTALSGSTGARLWSRSLPGGVYGGIATADLRGIGRQDVVAATSAGVYVLDGLTGAILGQVGAGIPTQNTVLITKDANGMAGITVAGYDAANAGIVAHYQLDDDAKPFVGGVGGWAMFHHDRALSGNAAHAF